MRYTTFVILLILVFSGCKKEWTCACTYTYNLGSQNISTSTAEQSEKISKKNADEWCDISSVDSSGYSRTCELK